MFEVESRSHVGGVWRRSGRCRWSLLPDQHRPLFQRTVRILLRNHRPRCLSIFHQHLNTVHNTLTSFYHKFTYCKSVNHNSAGCMLERVTCAYVCVRNTSGAVREVRGFLWSPRRLRPGGDFRRARAPYPIAECAGLANGGAARSGRRGTCARAPGRISSVLYAQLQHRSGWGLLVDRRYYFLCNFRG